MGYIGNQPGYGKPEVFVFTASGGETSVSTADDGRSINYAVGYVSVYLNGVLLVDGTDYTATNGSSISGLTALVASDVVTVVSFEVFAIPDAVSEQSGGAFLGDVTVPNLLVGDGGNIGSVSDPDAMAVSSGGVVTFSQGIALAAGKGIDFSAYGAGATIDSNLLDDYEEGTWTPSLAGLSMTNDDGAYTKIGRVVIAHFRINSSAVTDATTATLTGLPFNNRDLTTAGRSGAYLSYQGTGEYLTLLWNTGQTIIFVNFNGSAKNRTFISGELLYGTIIYETA